MKRYTLLVLTALCLPTLALAEDPRPEQIFEEGRILFFKGDFARAAARLEQAVKADPDKVSYKLLLARAYRHGGEEKKAVATLEKVLALQSDHVEAGIALADLLSAGKQYDRVIAVLEPLLKFKRDYPLYHLLAGAYYQKGRLDQARLAYELAIQLNPTNAEDHHQLGNIYLAQKRYAKSAEAYEAAGKLGISSALYHFKLASVYFSLHRYLGTLETVQAIGGKPGQIVGDRLLVEPIPGQESHFLAVTPRSALYQVIRARELGMDSFHLHFLEANTWLLAGQSAQADAIYRQLEKKLPPEDAGAFWFHWARVALDQEKYTLYLDRLNKAIAAEPEIYRPALSNALIQVANRYHQQGDLDRHIEMLEKAVAVSPLTSRLHLALGDAYWLKKDRPQAIGQYQMVLDLEPEFPHRTQLLNRIRGQDSSTLGIASRVAPRSQVQVSTGLDLSKVLCPITRKPVSAEFSTTFAGGTLFFASREARQTFLAKPTSYNCRARHQLFLTRQAQAIVCPLTGRRLNPTITVTIEDAEVPLCCKGCQSRVKRANPTEQLELLFNTSAFESSFKVVPQAPVSQK